MIVRVRRQLDIHHQHKAPLQKNQQLAGQLAKALQSGAGGFANRHEQIKSLIYRGEFDRSDLH